MAGRYSPSYKPGKVINSGGYVRITSGPSRGKYEHRAVIASLCQEFCFYPLNPKSGLPDGFHVDHLDHVKVHNCYQNLILIEASIHDHLSWLSWLDRPNRSQGVGHSQGPDDWCPTTPYHKPTAEELEEVPF